MLDNILSVTPIAVKSLVAAVVLFVLARLMGKKQISQLTFFDYTVGISIGSIAANMSVDQRISIKLGIISMLVWAMFPILLSIISTHSIIARRILDGTPTILIQKGMFIEKNLKKSKLTVNDLLEELRLKDVFNITDVEVATLETNGKLSIQKVVSSQTPTLSDLKLPSTYTGLVANVIIDGKLMKENMKQVSIDEMWINNEMIKNNINAVKDILLATCDSKRNIHFYKKGDGQDELDILQ